MANLFRKLWLIWLILVVTLGGGAPVLAQSAARLEISAPELGDFPQVTFYLEAFDDSDHPITDLQAVDIAILEDGQELAVESLSRLEPGLQVILAFNSGGGMAYSYEDSSRFEMLKQALLDWVSQQPAQSLDVYHLITNSETPAQRLQSAAAVFSALQVYQPDLLNSFPSSLTLTTALDTAAQPLADPYSHRSILLITGLPRGEALDALPAQIERAAELGVPVNVWLVGGEDVLDSFASGQLQDLAGRTGGAFHFFSGPEGLPSPEDYVADLRYLYFVGYRSQIQQAGSYPLQALVRRPGLELSSNTRTFQAQYSLPSPIFMNLPNRVDFPFPPLEGPLGPLVEQYPATVPVRVLIEFPDGNPRPVRESRLFVDGVLLASNTAEPFDRFIWQPEVSTITRQYTLRVEVEDQLGLVGSSIESAVEVGLPVVEPTPPLATALEIAFRVALSIGLGVVVVVLGLALLRRPRRKPARQAKAGVETRTRPLPQPHPEHSSLLNRAAPARLVRLSDEGVPQPGSNIALQRREIVLGSDAAKTTLAFDLPSVQGVHARLVHEGTTFKIMDAGSVAGTWVNYKPVSAQGQELHHGDLIYLGRLALRFELTQAKNLPQAKVMPYTEG